MSAPELHARNRHLLIKSIIETNMLEIQALTIQYKKSS